jgi:hypothetical protein
MIVHNKIDRVTFCEYCLYLSPSIRDWYEPNIAKSKLWKGVPQLFQINPQSLLTTWHPILKFDRKKSCELVEGIKSSCLSSTAKVFRRKEFVSFEIVLSSIVDSRSSPNLSLSSPALFYICISLSCSNSFAVLLTRLSISSCILHFTCS